MEKKPTTSTSSSSSSSNPSTTNNNNNNSNNRNNSTVSSEWNKEYDLEKSKISELQSLISSSKRPSTNIVRVSQLDSAKLDEEILDLLRSQFMKIFMFFNANFVQRFQPEINLILKSAIFKLSIFNLGTTYGNQLQNLTFRNEAAFDPSKGSDQLTKLTLSQKWLSGLITIGGEWAWSRINRFSISDGWSEQPPTDIRRKIWHFLNALETLYKVLSVLNFLTFLYDGKYVTLVNRLLSMRLVYAHPSLSRRISFEYMNRQLVWHGFTEFFLFIMPLINIDKLKSFIYRMFIRKSTATTNGNNSMSTQQLQQLQQQSVLQKCPICMNEPINIPYSADCGHLFCYYCIKTSIMIDSSFTCPKCNSLVSNIKRYLPYDNNNSNSNSPSPPPTTANNTDN
eukprot:gene7403-9098_t